MRTTYWIARRSLKLVTESQRHNKPSSTFMPMQACVIGLLIATVVFPQAPLSSPESGPNMVGCLRLNAPDSENYFWIVAQEYQGLDYVTELRFLLRSPSQSKRLEQYQSADHLLYMLPSSLNSQHLATIWEGGSHVGVRIFSLKQDKVSLIFDRQAPYPPEFLYGRMLLNTGKVLEGTGVHPAETEIYITEGDRYKLAATVPWPKRYEKVAQMEGQH